MYRHDGGQLHKHMGFVWRFRLIRKYFFSLFSNEFWKALGSLHWTFNPIHSWAQKRQIIQISKRANLGMQQLDESGVLCENLSCRMIFLEKWTKWLMECWWHVDNWPQYSKQRCSICFIHCLTRHMENYAKLVDKDRTSPCWAGSSIR